MRINTPAIGVQPAVTDSGAPRWRKVAGSAILGLGFVLGATKALLYEVLMCTSPVGLVANASPDLCQRLRDSANSPLLRYCVAV